MPHSCGPDPLKRSEAVIARIHVKPSPLGVASLLAKLPPHMENIGSMRKERIWERVGEVATLAPGREGERSRAPAAPAAGTAA